MLPEPISPEPREDVVAHMAAGLLGAYRYFRAHRQAGLVAALRNVGAASQGRAQRSLPVWRREEVQVLRRGDGELRLLTDAFPAQDFRHQSSDSRREGHWGFERGRPMVVGV
jgi:hypothetical protein